MYLNKNISDKGIYIHDSDGNNHFLEPNEEIILDRDCKNIYIESTIHDEKKKVKPKKEKEIMESDNNDE